MINRGGKILILWFCLAYPADAAPVIETLLTVSTSKEVPRVSEGDLIELADGRLCVVYSRFRGGGADEAAADIVMQTSVDAGKTWSPLIIIVPNEGNLNVMSVTLRRLKSGELLLFYLRKNSLDDCNLFVRRSKDELKTLGDPVRVTTLDGYHVVNNDRVLETSTGRLVVPAALHTGLDALGKKVAPAQFNLKGAPLVYFSDDQGRTWRRDASRIPPIEERKLILQEPGVVELTDGSLWMFMRTTEGSQYGCSSADAGVHWSEPRPTSLVSSCSPAVIERNPWTGELICVWNPTPGRRTPLCIAASRDEGRTWGKSVVLEGDPTSGFCYPSITWAHDKLFLTYGEFSRWKVVALSKDWLDAQLAGGALVHPHFHDNSIYNPDNMQTVGRFAGPGFGLARNAEVPVNGNFGGPHLSICQFAFADGSVHAVGVSIDEVTLGYLANRKDGQAISNKDFN